MYSCIYKSCQTFQCQNLGFRLLGIENLSRFLLSCLTPLVYLLPKTLNYIVFQSFDFERTDDGLFQKRVVRTELNIFIWNLSEGRER
jgi:hypothetical protein